MNDKNENIKFVTNIILYLLIIISFFSFSDAESSGLKPFIFYLFLSGIFTLLILSFIFIRNEKSYERQRHKIIDVNILGYISTIPFVCFFCLIFIRSLFLNIFKRSMKGEFSGFFSDFGKLVYKFTRADSLIVILFLVFSFSIFFLCYYIHRIKKNK